MQISSRYPLYKTVPAVNSTYCELKNLLKGYISC